MSIEQRLTRWMGRRTEVDALALIPLVFLALWALSVAILAVAGPASRDVSLGLMLVVITLLSVAGGDRATVATILGPIIVAVIAAILLAVAGSPLAPLTLALAAAWFGVWTFGGDRLWPIWARLVLRRTPRPDQAFVDAYGKVREAFGALAIGADARALWNETIALNEWRSYRTAALIDGRLAWFDLGAREADAARAGRMSARIAEETTAYLAIDPAAPVVDPHPERPTRGTCLEFLFPELEALLAVATPGQQRWMAVEAARFACRREGVLDETLGRAFDDAADGRPDQAARASLDPEQSPPPADGAEPAAFRRAIAWSSAWSAMAEPLDPTDAADAIYAAARCQDDADLAALADRLGSVLDEQARDRAPRVEPDPRVLERTRAAMAAAQERRLEWSPTSLLPPGLSLGALIILGVAAGVIGTALRVPFWPLIRDLARPSTLDVSLGVILVALVAWALLRIARRRTNASVVVGLFLTSYAAAVLIDPLVWAGDGLLSRLAPDFWAAVYADPPTVLPFAPYHGIAFAAMLVGLALVIRLDARERRSSATGPGTTAAEGS